MVLPPHKAAAGYQNLAAHSLGRADEGKDVKDPILNLEQGNPVAHWGRMIFYVADVDAFWAYLRGKGFDPETPRDASWGERYFHMSDPNGHELSFARPLQ